MQNQKNHLTREFGRSQLKTWLSPLSGVRGAMPERLFIRGSSDAFSLLERLPQRGLAVVGTRDPTPASRRRVRSWVSALAGADLIVLSGFARGIDSEAHEAALRAGLPTIAFLGAGLDVDYPAGNGRLRERILSQGGLLVSEFGPHEPPRAGHFHARNRIIAAASAAVVVIEARFRSGALNTAGWAKKMDIPVFAVPCTPGDAVFSGNQRLLDADVPARVFWGPRSLEVVWLELVSHGKRMRNLTAIPGGLSDDCAIVRRMVADCAERRGGVLPEVLVERAHRLGWSPQRLFEALDRLDADGILGEEGGLLVLR